MLSISSEGGIRQIVIFSSAGKPIYSHGINELSFTTLISSSLTAVTSKLSFVLSQEKTSFNNELKKVPVAEYLKWMSSNTHRIVIIERQGIFLCCISSFQNDPIAYIKSMLEYTYYQLIMLLTGSIHKTLKLRPNVDIQQMISHSDINIIDQCIYSIQINVDSLYWYYSLQKNRKFPKIPEKNSCSIFPVQPLNLYIESQPLDPSIRKEINKTISRISIEGLLGGIMFASTRLVTWFGSKYIKNLPSTDFSLLKNITITLFNKNKNSSNELWVPICLPCISTISYIYCYIHYWPSVKQSFCSEGNICFILLSSSNDTNIFEKFSLHSNHCLEYLTSDSKYNEVINSLKLTSIDLNLLLSREQIFKEIDIYHFVYLSVTKNCYISSKIHPEIHNLLNIFQIYYKITELAHSQLRKKKDSSITLIIHTKRNKFLATLSQEFHLFLTFPISANISESHLNIIIDKIRENHKYFFI